MAKRIHKLRQIPTYLQHKILCRLIKIRQRNSRSARKRFEKWDAEIELACVHATSLKGYVQSHGPDNFCVCVWGGVVLRGQTNFSPAGAEKFVCMDWRDQGGCKAKPFCEGESTSPHKIVMPGETRICFKHKLLGKMNYGGEVTTKNKILLVHFKWESPGPKIS